MKMIRPWAMLLMLCALPMATAVSQDTQCFPPADGGHSTSVPAAQMKFEDRGFRGITGKITIVDEYGDGRTRRHGTFMRFSPGFVSHLHTHTYDYYAVVIQGVMANYRPGGPQVKMAPGSYWYQQGHEPHITACLSKDECLAFVVQSQKFDVQDLDKTK